MKKRLIPFALLLCLMALTCAAAQAGESKEPTSGFQAVSKEQAYQAAIDLTPKTDANVAVDEAGGKYPGAAKMELVYKQAQEGKEYALFVLTNEDPPTADNIAYIDQKSADANGVVSFTIYPKKLPETSSGADYYVYISSNTDASAGTGITAYTKVATFSYYAAATVMMGDVSDSKTIDVADALMILEHLAQMRTLEGRQAAAADVSGNSIIDVADVLMILERLATMRDANWALIT